MKLLRILGAAKMAWLRALPLLRDERVPGFLKWGAGASALLIISPLDLFSDIPVLGALDDAALLTGLAMLFVTLASRHTMKIATATHPSGEALALREV